jgi:hypothetical protein
MRTQRNRRPEPPSLFRGKLRKDASVTLTAQHQRKVAKAMERLGLKLADVIALLIDRHAETVTRDDPDTYGPLRQMVASLGGSLTHVKRDEPRGGTWVLTLGENELRIPSIRAKRYPPLDACFRLKPGVTVPRSRQDHTHEIDPAGLAKLFSLLASSPRRSQPESESIATPLQMELTDNPGVPRAQR